MRVLLSEGSGLTSRQVATRLGALGHHVEVLSSTPFCLTRFTRHVRALHRVPRFADDPMAWFDAANRIARLRAIDVLLPTQEQVAVLSAQRSRLEVATVVPDFAALRRVQDKIEAWRTLHAIGIPQPASVVVRQQERSCRDRAVSGVREATDLDRERRRPPRRHGGRTRRRSVRRSGSVRRSCWYRRKPRARLRWCRRSPTTAGSSHHANLRVIEGIGGGAAVKESIQLPKLENICRRWCRRSTGMGPSRWMSSSLVMDRWSSTSIRGWSSRSTHSSPASISSAPCSSWPGRSSPGRAGRARRRALAPTSAVCPGRSGTRAARRGAARADCRAAMPRRL